MDESTKLTLINNLVATKAMLSASSGTLNALNQSSFPVGGPVVVIPSLPMAGQAIKMQGEAVTKLVGIIEKLLNEI